MEPFSLEQSLKDFGIKIKSEADLLEAEADADDYFDVGDDSDDDQELIYSYARTDSSTYGNSSTSYTASRYGYGSSQYQPSAQNSGGVPSVSGGGGRKRKQQLCTLDRDDSFPEEITFTDINSMEREFKSEGMDLHMFTKRKDKPPLYLLNPEDFRQDPMKQYQIRRAIITYRHHQEKKELIRQLKDENSKLRAVVHLFKKREDAILKGCNCAKTMEIVLSSNPEDIMQLPAPKPKPLPSIPPLPRCRGRMNLEKQDEVIKSQVEPEDIFKTYGANVVKPLASGMKIERREQPTESDYRNEPSNIAEDVPAKIVPGRASTGSMIDAKSNGVNGVPSTTRAPPASKGPARIRQVGKLTLEQIHRIVSLHKNSNNRRINNC
jgi:hypothetical protein